MAFDPRNYPTQYALIKEVWEKFVFGESLDGTDELEYYRAKCAMFKHKFLSTKADNYKEKQYLRRCLAAESEAERIRKEILEKNSGLVIIIRR